jgi:hypothetical protein
MTLGDPSLIASTISGAVLRRPGRDSDLDAGLDRLAGVASHLDGAHPQAWATP